MDTVDLYVPSKNVRDSSTCSVTEELMLYQGASLLQTASNDF